MPSDDPLSHLPQKAHKKKFHNYFQLHTATINFFSFLKMSTKSLTHAINGVFSVYKPKGWTSRKATDFVQYALSNELWKETEPIKRKQRVKIGHGGTLDPMAEGVLVLGVGKGCKELEEYLKGTKEYLVTAKFGEATDTYDATGTVVKMESTQHITRELINQKLCSFKGNITQVPPM